MRKFFLVLLILLSVFLLGASSSRKVPSAYLEYVGLISQTGTNAPTAIELENTLGEKITFYYHGVGQYSMRAPYGSELFYDDRTIILVGNVNYLEAEVGNSYTINLYALGNDALHLQTIVVRVYP